MRNTSIPKVAIVIRESFPTDYGVVALGAAEYDAAPVQLIPCADCGRKFSAKALERHVAVCKKVNTKRKAFSAADHRAAAIAEANGAEMSAGPRKKKGRKAAAAEAEAEAKAKKAKKSVRELAKSAV